MTIHVLVEGPSESAFFTRWAPRLLPGVSLKVHPHQGKGALPARLDERPNPRSRGLLHQLPAKLRAFASGATAKQDSILILVDADDTDVARLKTDIERTVQECAPHLKVGSPDTFVG